MSQKRNTRRWAMVLGLLLAACGGGGGSDSTGSANGGDFSLAGGDTTTDDRTGLAFEHPSANLSSEEEDRHNTGDRAFGSIFVAPPATNNPGLGPIFNNNSCDGCHVKNGRGLPLFASGSTGSQAVVKISSPTGNPEQPGSPGAVGSLGTQINDHATFGFTPEAAIQISYSIERGTYGDGSFYELRKPRINLSNSQIPRSGVNFSFRTAPAVFGLGLLEAIPESEILSRVDADDADGDGISGRANMVWDQEKGVPAVGRFGRKASRPTLRQQTAGAYKEDMGVTNPIFPGSNGEQEIDEATLAAATFYVQSLAVPRNTVENSEVSKQGFALFQTFGCASCHVPRLKTGAHPERSLQNQEITAFTDLLLHDMGPGLSDGRQDFLASGNEWKTQPLWGIGITATILSQTATYLHDGRARNLDEAILWHGGEAEAAKEKFRLADRASREAIIAFLRSL